MEPDGHLRVAIHRMGTHTYDRAEIEAAVGSALSRVFGGDDAGNDAGGMLVQLVIPGDTVVLKPNMVVWSQAPGARGQCVTTHAEVVRAVALLAASALHGRGKLVIADGPVPDSDFLTTAELMGLPEVSIEIEERFGIPCELVDLRDDPAGYADFDLADRSEFADRTAADRLHSTYPDVAATRAAHSDGRHRYNIARTPLLADVLINLPKMKTHPKTGVSLSLKNMVGVSGDRSLLPHFAVGRPSDGGDESPWSPGSLRARQKALRTVKRLVGRAGLGAGRARVLKRAGRQMLGTRAVNSGSWHGNDTAWRMVLDLNKILRYGRPDGSLGTSPVRRGLIVVDGVVAGEGDGPIRPEPKMAGLVVAGLNPVAVDHAAVALMGFDPVRLRMVDRAWRICELPLTDFSPQEVRCCSNMAEWEGTLADLLQAPHCGFVPCSGWRGQVERRPGAAAGRGRTGETHA